MKMKNEKSIVPVLLLPLLSLLPTDRSGVP